MCQLLGAGPTVCEARLPACLSSVRRKSTIKNDRLFVFCATNKLNKAVLKLFGLIGVLTFTPPEPDDDQFDSPSYFSRKTMQRMLDILNDPFLDVHRIHIFQTFVAMFQCYQQKDGPSEVNSAAYIRLHRNPKLIRLTISLVHENASNWLPPFASSLMALVRDLAVTTSLSEILGLIPVLAQVLNRLFVRYTP
jgi:hypothetical protein